MSPESLAGAGTRDLRDLVAAWEEQIRAGRRAGMVALVTSVEERWRRASSDERRFNALQLVRLGPNEVRHSQILAWCLNPLAEHGQGSAFARAFVRACGVELDDEALGRYRVRTEYVGAEARTDVVLYRRGVFVLAVEHKIYAELGESQLDREYRDLVRLAGLLGVSPERRYAVYLTPEGRRPVGQTAGRWRALAHSTLADGFGREVARMSSARARYLVEDWLEILAGFGGDGEGVEAATGDMLDGGSDVEASSERR